MLYANRRGAQANPRCRARLIQRREIDGPGEHLVEVIAGGQGIGNQRPDQIARERRVAPWERQPQRIIPALGNNQARAR